MATFLMYIHSVAIAKGGEMTCKTQKKTSISGFGTGEERCKRKEEGERRKERERERDRKK